MSTIPIYVYIGPNVTLNTSTETSYSFTDNVQITFNFVKDINDNRTSMFIVKSPGEIKGRLENMIGCVITNANLYTLEEEELNHGPHFTLPLDAPPLLIFTSFQAKLKQTIEFYQWQNNIIEKAINLGLTSVPGANRYVGRIRHSLIKPNLPESSFMQRFEIRKVRAIELNRNAVLPTEEGLFTVCYRSVKTEAELAIFYEEVGNKTMQMMIFLAIVEDQHIKCRQWCLTSKIWTNPTCRFVVYHRLLGGDQIKLNEIIKCGIYQANQIPWISRTLSQPSVSSSKIDLIAEGIHSLRLTESELKI